MFDNNIWLTCLHIPGVSNLAEEQLHKFQGELEWSLNSDMFSKICQLWVEPSIDIFATRLNAKVLQFCCWNPDLDAKFIDCYTINWSDFNSVYIFCPFSLLGRSVQKIRMDRARGIVIAPIWPNRQWFTALMKTLVDIPAVLLLKVNLILQLPHSNREHPCHRNLH